MSKPYLATEPIYLNGARAFNPGDVVPDSHVERHGLHDQVAREGTKAADAATSPTSATS